MKVLLQRVTYGAVEIDNKIVGEINKGFVIFVGVAGDDTEKDIDYVIHKIINLRVFSDDEGRFNLSAIDVAASLLIVSQFTLLADTKKGHRPSFTMAASLEQAEFLFNKFVDRLKTSGLKIATGIFQKYMLVTIKNDGPVTIMLDSEDKIKRQR